MSGLSASVTADDAAFVDRDAPTRSLPYAPIG